MGIEVITNELARACRGEHVTANSEVVRNLNRKAKHTTANSEKMAGAVALYAGGAVRDKGIQVLDEMLREEEARGPQPWELLCPDPHAGMHRLAEAAIVAAGLNGQAPRELADRQAVQTGLRLRLCDLVATPDGDVTGLPGLRANGPNLPRMAETLEYRQIRVLPHLGARGNRRKLESWRPTTDAQATWSMPAYWWSRIMATRKGERMLEGVLGRIGPLPCSLPLGLIVQAGEGWTLAYLDDPGESQRRRYTVTGSVAARKDKDHVEDCTSAVLVRWGKPGRHRVTTVQTWRLPPPAPPGPVLRETRIPGPVPVVPKGAGMVEWGGQP